MAFGKRAGLALAALAAVREKRPQLVLTDVFLIASGTNERQVGSIVDAIEESLHKLGSKPLRREGKSEGRWVLIDYGAVIVHVFAPEEREYYGLERLWGKAAQVVRVV